MERAYKYRIYPTKEQQQLIQRTFGCARFVYNHFLAYRKELYETKGETANYYACNKLLTALKKELPWLSEVDCLALQCSTKDLDAAYQNFFHRVKKGEIPGYPHFKSKHDRNKSYRSRNIHGNIKVLDDAVQLPKLGLVKCRVSRPIEGRILSVTVSQVPSGKYFVSLCCTGVEIPPLPFTGAVVGVDLGLHDLAITSDGVKYPNPKNYTKAQKRLARLQRQLSRKSKGSRNREKARVKVARLQERIANQRHDALHKLTTALVRQYDVICIEDLAPGNMVKNHKLAKHIADASFGEVRRQLTYKAAWYGKVLSVIDRFFPSSQLCSVCGYRNTETKDLSVRKWTCPDCGATHDRDVNAAENIVKEGLRLLA